MIACYASYTGGVNYHNHAIIGKACQIDKQAEHMCQIHLGPTFSIKFLAISNFISEVSCNSLSLCLSA